MIEFVPDVSEEGSAGFEEFDKCDGFSEVRVAWVGIATEGVEDEDVEVLEEGNAFGWDVAHVSKIGGGAEAVSGDLLAAVGNRDPSEAGSEEVNACSGSGVEAVEFDAGACRVAVGGVEGIVENALDRGSGGFVGVEGERLGILEREWAEIVHAEDVVGVGVRVENGVEAGDMFAESLGVEVGSGVDEHGVAGVFNEDGRAGTAVVRVSGGANGAGAAEGGDTHRGSAAQERQGGGHRIGIIGQWMGVRPGVGGSLALAVAAWRRRSGLALG